MGAVGATEAGVEEGEGWRGTGGVCDFALERRLGRAEGFRDEAVEVESRVDEGVVEFSAAAATAFFRASASFGAAAEAAAARASFAFFLALRCAAKVDIDRKTLLQTDSCKVEERFWSKASCREGVLGETDQGARQEGLQKVSKGAAQLVNRPKNRNEDLS